MPDDRLSNDDGMIDRDRIADVSVLAAVPARAAVAGPVIGR